MHPILRLIGIGTVFVATTFCWLVLAGIMESRTYSQESELRGAVSELWGAELHQQVPTATSVWETQRSVVETKTEGDRTWTETKRVTDVHRNELVAERTRVDASIALDERRKGLVWYPLYDVDFQGQWAWTHDSPDGWLELAFAFPDGNGIYDGFTFVVDGVEHELQPQYGQVKLSVPVKRGQRVELVSGYRSRGMSTFAYRPTMGQVSSLQDFEFVLRTDFDAIDFPANTMSPSTKTADKGGWTLSWAFDRVVTGRGIGMVMPERIQPGELATSLTLSAPITLFFFFLVVYVLSLLRGIDIHPMNYLFIAGAFFAFHLLFGYSADHLPVEMAFGLSSLVSIVLVTSYLRLVVSARFALVESAIAQLVYLVGFSLAHFWDGYTGLTITVLSILTLFLLMQWTGRIRWSEVLFMTVRPKRDDAVAVG